MSRSSILLTASTIFTGSPSLRKIADPPSVPTSFIKSEKQRAGNRTGFRDAFPSQAVDVLGTTPKASAKRSKLTRHQRLVARQKQAALPSPCQALAKACPHGIASLRAALQSEARPVLLRDHGGSRPARRHHHVVARRHGIYSRPQDGRAPSSSNSLLDGSSPPATPQGGGETRPRSRRHDDAAQTPLRFPLVFHSAPSDRPRPTTSSKTHAPQRPKAERPHTAAAPLSRIR